MKTATQRKPDTPIDRLMYRAGAMNALLDLRQEHDEYDEEDLDTKKKSGKSGKGERSGLFAAAMREIFRRVRKTLSYLGASQPGDGHPQEEQVPDIAWFRPLMQNNASWVLYWPEITV